MTAIDCVRRRTNADGSIVCDVVAPLGFEALAGVASENSPCRTCVAEWRDGPPDPDDPSTWTPTLLVMARSFDADQEPPPPACFHLGAVVVHSCCNRKRVYACDAPEASGRKRTTVVVCGTCPAYDPDA